MRRCVSRSHRFRLAIQAITRYAGLQQAVWHIVSEGHVAVNLLLRFLTWMGMHTSMNSMNLAQWLLRFWKTDGGIGFRCR
jgi:hypothetical protein